jgi:hypothetical protein
MNVNVGSSNNVAWTYVDASLSMTNSIVSASALERTTGWTKSDEMAWPSQVLSIQMEYESYESHES